MITTRIIKFRGLDKKRKEWVYGYFYTSGLTHLILEPGEPGIPEQHIEVDAESIGQYTGMIDKNNTRIYEGDIVKHEWYNNALPFEVKSLEEFYDHMSDSGDVVMGESSYIEIIGNIFENPEILK